MKNVDLILPLSIIIPALAGIFILLSKKESQGFWKSFTYIGFGFPLFSAIVLYSQFDETIHYNFKMKLHADEFNDSLQKIELSSPIYPIIQNYTGEISSDTSKIKQNLLNQLTQPVLWSKTMNRISNTASCLIEIGPKNVLCGLSKGYDFSSIFYTADLNFKKKVQDI